MFQACKKAPLKPAETSDQALIQSAKEFFESHLQQATAISTGNNRVKAVKRPYWQAAYTSPSPTGWVVIVPVFYDKDLVVKTSISGSNFFSLNYLTKLVMHKDSSGFNSQLVTFFPDSSYEASKNNQYSGLIFTEAWDGASQTKYKIAQGLTLME